MVAILFPLLAATLASAATLVPRTSFTCANYALCCTADASTTTDAIVATGCTAGTNLQTTTCSLPNYSLCCALSVPSLGVGIRCAVSDGYVLPNHSSFVIHGFKDSAATTSKGYLKINSGSTWTWESSTSTATVFTSTSGTPFAIEKSGSTTGDIMLVAPNGNTYGELDSGSTAQSFWVATGVSATYSSKTIYGLSITFTDASTGNTAVGDVYSCQESTSTLVTDLKVVTDGNSNQVNSLAGAYAAHGIIPGQVWLFAEAY